MVGGQTHRSQHLHFAPRRKRHTGRRVAVGIFAAILIVAAAAAVKAFVASTPDLTIKQVFKSQLELPGTPPTPAWPAQGEAAVGVEGLPPLGSSGPHTPLPIASLAKVMTAYVVLQDHPISPNQGGFTLAIKPADVADYNARLAQSESVVTVSLGETLDERQLLQGLLVASGNNVASTLARYDAGSVGAFVRKMQSTAATLGMDHTTYTDPSGVQPSTVSTATDQLVLASHAITDPVFAQTVGMAQVTLPVAGTATNFNTAVGKGGFIGIKTGSDSSSGGCLMFANRQTVDGKGFTILGAVLGQGAGESGTATLVAAAVSASTSLVQSVAAAVKKAEILPAGTVMAVVSDAAGKTVQAATSGAISALGYGGTAFPLSMSLYKLGSKLRNGQVVGKVSIPGGESVEIRALSTMPGLSFSWKLRHDY